MEMQQHLARPPAMCLYSNVAMLESQHVETEGKINLGHPIIEDFYCNRAGFFSPLGYSITIGWLSP